MFVLLVFWKSEIIQLLEYQFLHHRILPAVDIMCTKTLWQKIKNMYALWKVWYIIISFARFSGRCVQMGW